jgi:hypothetical protein
MFSIHRINVAHTTGNQAAMISLYPFGKAAERTHIWTSELTSDQTSDIKTTLSPDGLNQAVSGGRFERTSDT